ncbi:hypothetical protein B0T26DRAFT_745038 [Lasiosphaeria miniovina]|uniref:Uncharacterized protein n=1 Tax=Lasiosphaeria miniovina TaxID=1954250 RepID=A0AA40ED14_9PEZI|nr:uncharacterized protein B0T26DRAFT_745038 [Lasiosphaeria miniovina]KAK0732936.1 hypothetical protein B0T26DRAFT_745038 [Lasiosphaeria miniovina]
MAIYDIGETVVYRGADGSESVGIIDSVVEPLTDTASAAYEVQDIKTGHMIHIYETRILGINDYHF